MKNPYGILNGQLITAADAERGLACNCSCPGCGAKLQAHKGQIRKPYFSHYKGDDCGAGIETATHMLAKKIIENERRLILPELIVYPNWAALGYIDQQYQEVATDIHSKYKTVIVPAWKRINVEKVSLEKKLGKIIPDVTVEVGGRVLYVEIMVTHGIDEDKLELIKKKNLNVVEYDFSKMKEVPDKTHLTRVLTSSYKGAKNGRGRSAWVNNSRELGVCAADEK